MNRALILATLALAGAAALPSAASADTDPRCVGNGALDVKYCVDPDSSCLLVSYSSAAGTRCLVRKP